MKSQNENNENTNKTSHSITTPWSTITSMQMSQMERNQQRVLKDEEARQVAAGEFSLRVGMRKNVKWNKLMTFA